MEKELAQYRSWELGPQGYPDLTPNILGCPCPPSPASSNHLHGFRKLRLIFPSQTKGPSPQALSRSDRPLVHVAPVFRRPKQLAWWLSLVTEDQQGRGLEPGAETWEAHGGAPPIPAMWAPVPASRRLASFSPPQAAPPHPASSMRTSTPIQGQGGRP